MAALLPALALAGLAAVTAEHRLQCSSLPSFDNSDVGRQIFLRQLFIFVLCAAVHLLRVRVRGGQRAAGRRVQHRAVRTPAQPPDQEQEYGETRYP